MTYVALLRGINVGGRVLVAMGELRALVERLGFTDVASIGQSGNLAFRGKARTVPALERLLETETDRQLRVRADFMIRTSDELTQAVARNPFPKEADRDPGHLLLMFLRDSPARTRVRSLEAANTGPEYFRVDGRHAYVVYPDGVGRSKLTHGIIERELGTRATGRNWNTVMKLANLVSE